MKYLFDLLNRLHDKVVRRLEIMGKKDDRRMKRLLAVLGNGSPTEANVKFLVALIGVFFVVLVWALSYAYFILTHLVRFVFWLAK